MPSESSSAVVAICCRLPEGLQPELLEDWTRPVRSARLAVTWIVSPDDLEAAAGQLASRDELDRLAVELPNDWFAADVRQSLIRQRFAAIRRVASSVDAVVIRSATGAAPPAAVRPELLVEHGVRLVVTKDLGSWHGRRSRRPGPPGWSCSSPVWGLWEVGFSSKTPRGWFGGMLPIVLGPSFESGMLSVIQTGQVAGQSKREARQRFERTLHWIARSAAARRPRIDAVTLSQLATILASAAGGGGQRSVLAAA